jgi:hypothetical protein
MSQRRNKSNKEKSKKNNRLQNCCSLTRPIIGNEAFQNRNVNIIKVADNNMDCNHLF